MLSIRDTREGGHAINARVVTLSFPSTFPSMAVELLLSKDIAT